MKQASSHQPHYRNWFWLVVAALSLVLFLGGCCTNKITKNHDLRSQHGIRTRGVTPTTTQSGHGNQTISSTLVPNMNGDYRLSMTPGAGPEGLFPQQFSLYPHQPTRHFDVYSPPIRSLYSQVFWKSLDPVNLPQPIVDEFHSKIMAVVGFEVDQVLNLPNGTELSIPMNAVYNHHYECTMIGGDTYFELATTTTRATHDMMDTLHNQQSQPQETIMGHGKPLPYWKPSSQNPLDSQEFRGANGGEMRQSFHGYAPGFAQMIQSPKQFQVIPMQIDTWHREQMSLMDGSQTRFVPGPLPRSSLAPTNNPLYSGLLECPVTTRITKHLPLAFQLWNQPGSCPQGSQQVPTSQDCFDMVSTLLSNYPSAAIVNRSGTTLDRPLGCSVSLLESHNNTDIIVAFFNTNATTTTMTTTTVDCTSPQNRLYLAHSPTNALIDWSLRIDTDTNEIDLTLTGPIDVWFAIGFGAQAMKDEPWTIVIEPTTDSTAEDSDTTTTTTTKVTERILGDHSGGSEIDSPTLQLLGETTTDTTRTLHVRRMAVGHPYYDFDVHNMTEVVLISAVGSSPTFGYHRAKEPSSAYLLPVSESGSTGGTCVCQQEPPPFGQSKGATLQYHPVKDQPGEQGSAENVVWNNHCDPAPRGTLLAQKNPTCDVRTYAGGQLACHHMWSLLDADQEIPWPDQPIEYRLKFRFWFQDYDPSYHTQVKFATWGIASPVEYDVPQCAANIPGCSQDSSTGLWIHTIQGTFIPNQSGRLVAAHFHCHAPTCLSMSLYMCEAGTPLEDCTASTGQLLCHQQANYGHNENDNGEQPFQEPGFISVPPCLWGSKEFGLEEPIDFRGKTLFATKTANATFGHHGEMAWMQVHFV